MKSEFRLVIPARPNNEWYGGWAAGSILAHYIHSLKCGGKVFWYQNIWRKGFGPHKRYIDDRWEQIRKKPCINKNGPCISETGYFYETGTLNITWAFKLEKIIKREEIKESEKGYIPDFRWVYYDDDEEKQDWILISDMKKLKEPIRFIGGTKFRFWPHKKPKSGHIRNNCFVCGFPKLNPNNLLTPKKEDLSNLYLKQFLMKGSKEEKFREQNVQDALFVALLEKGFVFSKEGVIKKSNEDRGRYDYLFEKGGKYFAIETKVEDDPGAPGQLSEYIQAVRKEKKIPKNKIMGIIICGKASQKTRERASRRGYEIIEYRLSLDFPELFKK